MKIDLKKTSPTIFVMHWCWRSGSDFCIGSLEHSQSIAEKFVSIVKKIMKGTQTLILKLKQFVRHGFITFQQ